VRLALVSDIHANLPALEAVLADVASRPDVAATYHVGDLVGYSSQPDAVVARIAAEGIGGVAGNYDSTVAASHAHCGCRSESPRQEELAHASFAWTCANTSASAKRMLGALPFRMDIRPLGGHRAGPPSRSWRARRRSRRGPRRAAWSARRWTRSTTRGPPAPSGGC